MPTEKEKYDDSHFVLEFLLEANMNSEEGIDDVAEDYVDRHLANIKQLIKKSKQKIQNQIYNPVYLNEQTVRYATNYHKTWTHKSVTLLMQESGNFNPIEVVKDRARKVVLQALDAGWHGPPFSAIDLAKILRFDIVPNDSIPDARTISLKNGKVLVEYNPFQQPTRMNFSIAHEIAHTLFSDFREEIRNREEKPEENRELEQLCNVGAAELQLPYMIFPGDANNIKKISVTNLVELANIYKSSLESIFNGFISAVDKSCAALFFTLQDEKRLILGYSKASLKFDLSIPDNFVLPEDSKGYDCLTPGTSQSETVRWSFLNENYDVFYVGISPVRHEKKPRVGVIIIPNTDGEYLQNRKITINYGDVSKPIGKGIKIIAQVVNTSASLARGVGKSLSSNFPEIINALKEWKENKSQFILGESQLVFVKKDLYVFQMLAQSGLFSKDGKPPINYTALQTCLKKLREAAIEFNAEIHMPLIGTGNAKGDWSIIEGLIYSELVNQNVKVNIYLWGAKKPDNFSPKESLSLFNEESTWERKK